MNKYASYGIVILRELRKAEKPLSQIVLGETLGVTPTYAQQVLIQLIDAGLVKSTRGPYGGYSLADPRHKATVLEVDRAMTMAKTPEGNAKPTPSEEMAKKVKARLDDALKRMGVDKL